MLIKWAVGAACAEVGVFMLASVIGGVWGTTLAIMMFWLVPLSSIVMSFVFLVKRSNNAAASFGVLLGSTVVFLLAMFGSMH